MLHAAETTSSGRLPDFYDITNLQEHHRALVILAHGQDRSQRGVAAIRGLAFDQLTEDARRYLLLTFVTGSRGFFVFLGLAWLCL